ncbi:MAG: sugar phosphate isomerase/epimerase, partial [Lentisphaeria bacterium]|nr:sugar phosphate isomerase/epimerase [Lentisphaeria bacterium]
MIKIGLSSYSMSRAINDGRMDVFQVMDYIVENGGKHMEIVPCGKLILNGNNELIDQIVAHAGRIGLELSSYTIG